MFVRGTVGDATTRRYGGETVSPKWTTGIVDDVCNNRAHVVDEVRAFSYSSNNNNKQKSTCKASMHERTRLGLCADRD